jgi:hypothetical protein
MIWIIVLLIVIICFLWFDLWFYRKNEIIFGRTFRAAEKKSDIVIIFNSGGWGVVRYKDAKDLNPIIENIKKHLKGKKVTVVPYYITESHLVGRIAYLKDYLSFFSKESKQVASILEESQKDVILIGLSNGALLVDRAMERMKHKKNIISIELGKPFFGGHSKNKNILLINDKRDALSNGNILKLLKTLILSPINWIRKEIAIGLALRIDGHIYDWETYEKVITKFLDKKLCLKK